jgi:hypothetical protein
VDIAERCRQIRLFLRSTQPVIPATAHGPCATRRGIEQGIGTWNCGGEEHRFSYNRERQQTKCVISEGRRSFGEAEYFLLDRTIGGLAIQKEQIVLNQIGCGATIDRSMLFAD